MAAADGTAGPTWPELLGSNHWDGLLDPLHPNLRRLILRCGDLCQATYDAFNSDPKSRYGGSSRYGKRDFFAKVAAPTDLAAGYEVAAFLYATAEADAVPGSFLLHPLSREAWSRESNWMGYVAVSSDATSRALGRREIYVAWRGTTRGLEWVDVLRPEHVSAAPLLAAAAAAAPAGSRRDTHWYDGVLGRVHDVVDAGDAAAGVGEEPRVMKGWYTIYTSSDPKSPFCKKSAREQLLTKLRELVDLYRDEELSLTLAGHSLGACLAVLSAFDVVENGLSKVGDRPPFPVCAVAFGSPKVGDDGFAGLLRRLPGLRVLHVRNEIDLIPLYPGGVLGYEPITSSELVVDTRVSKYLKDSNNPSDWHNLQALLHVVAGWKGKAEGGGGGFELVEKRSVALVNKSSGYLKEECLVPESWWVQKNKGMALGDDGEWRLAPPGEDDVPVAEF